MKEFRKTKNGFFICEECNKIFKSIVGLSHHIKIHCNNKSYYDKWINESDNKCKICNKETNYLGWNRGYSKTCCQECESIIKKQTLIKKYNVDNPSKVKEIQQKRIITYLSHLDKINLKRNKTYKLRFNSHPLANEEIKQKIIETNLSKYGCKYPMQNKKIKEKSLMTFKKDIM